MFPAMPTMHTVFSKLEAKDSYWSIVLDKNLSLLTAFNSPSSNQRYKFNWLPFGINVSQDLFQEAMDAITKDLDGVVSIADDIWFLMLMKGNTMKIYTISCYVPKLMDSCSTKTNAS